MDCSIVSVRIGVCLRLFGQWRAGSTGEHRLVWTCLDTHRTDSCERRNTSAVDRRDTNCDEPCRLDTRCSMLRQWWNDGHLVVSWRAMQWEKRLLLILNWFWRQKTHLFWSKIVQLLWLNTYICIGTGRSCECSAWRSNCIHRNNRRRNVCCGGISLAQVNGDAIVQLALVHSPVGLVTAHLTQHRDRQCASHSSSWLRFNFGLWFKDTNDTSTGLISVRTSVVRVTIHHRWIGFIS